MEVFVLGTSQSVASAPTRERMFVDLDEIYDALASLQEGRGVLAEAIPLATCGRLEIYGMATDVDRAAAVLAHLLARRTKIDRTELADHTYLLRGPAAVRHLFRVAAGLDSVVHGEAQILGQVRDAAHHPRIDSVEGPHLHRLFQSALTAGKRVRSETQIGRGAASLASASLDILKREVGPLSSLSALVLGAGKTGTLIARLLRRSGVKRLVVANRTIANATRLAAELDCEAYHLERGMELLPQVDLVVGAVTASEPLILAGELRKYSATPRYFLDLAHPGNFDTALADLPGVRLFNLEHVFERLATAQRTRADAIPRAESIVDEEVQAFLAWLLARENVELLKAIRSHALNQALAEAERHHDGRETEQRERMRRLARSVAKAILHQPTVAIREADKRTEKGRVLLGNAAAMFGLDRAGPAADSKS